MELINGSCFIEQFEYYQETIFNDRRVATFKLMAESLRFAVHIIEHADSFGTYEALKRENSRSLYIQLRTAALLTKLSGLDNTTDNNIQRFVLAALEAYGPDNVNTESFKYYFSCMDVALPHDELRTYAEKNWVNIISALFIAAKQLEDFENIKALFEKYHIDYKHFMEDSKNEGLLQENLGDYVDRETTKWVNEGNNTVFSEADWEALHTKIEGRRKDIFNAFLLHDDFYDESAYFDADGLDHLIEQNVAKDKKVKAANLVNRQNYTDPEDEKMVEEIEELFNGEADQEFIIKKTGSLGLPF